MMGSKPKGQSAFDFSQSALDFKEQLWKRLKTKAMLAPVQALEDDDLEWVNAAGMTVRQEADDQLV